MLIILMLMGHKVKVIIMQHVDTHILASTNRLDHNHNNRQLLPIYAGSLIGFLLISMWIQTNANYKHCSLPMILAEPLLTLNRILCQLASQLTSHSRPSTGVIWNILWLIVLDYCIKYCCLTTACSNKETSVKLKPYQLHSTPFKVNLWPH